MILAGIAASPVRIMKRRLSARATISRMRGGRVGLALCGRASCVGRRVMARIETSDITADTAKDMR